MVCVCVRMVLGLGIGSSKWCLRDEKKRIKLSKRIERKQQINKNGRKINAKQRRQSTRHLRLPINMQIVANRMNTIGSYKGGALQRFLLFCVCSNFLSLIRLFRVDGVLSASHVRTCIVIALKFEINFPTGDEKKQYFGIGSHDSSRTLFSLQYLLLLLAPFGSARLGSFCKWRIFGWRSFRK